MATFAKVQKFDKVFTPAQGKHACIIEFSESYKMMDKATGEYRKKDGCDVLYKTITFFDMDAKTQFSQRFSDGQIYYLLKSLAQTHEEFEGKTQSQIVKAVAESPVDIFVSKHPQYGLQFSGYAPKG
jgi:hypothetical protein